MSTYQRYSDEKSLGIDNNSATCSKRIGSINLSVIENSPRDSINDTFTTAIEDDEDETQYLSILETTRDVTLEDLHNLNMTNSKIKIPELEYSSGSGSSDLTDSGEQQVVIFKVEGSDDLYGIQLAQDEEGNIQKYQFQFRTNEDGQLEAIPDTIQLLPYETDHNQETIGDGTEEVGTLQEQIHTDEEQVLHNQVFVSEETESNTIYPSDLLQEQEVILTENENDNQIDNQSVGLSENTLLVLLKNDLVLQGVENVSGCAIEDKEDNLESDFIEDEIIDVKPGIVELQKAYPEADPSDIKQEYHENEGKSFQTEETAKIPCENENAVQEETVTADPLQYHSEGDTYDTDTQDEETLIEYQHFDSQTVGEVCEESNDPDNFLNQQDDSQEGHYSNIYITNGDIEELSCNTELHQHMIQENVHYLQEEIRDNDSCNEDYEIVDGLPVTAEGDISEASSSSLYDQGSLYNEMIMQQLPSQKQNSPIITNILKQPMDSNTARSSKKKPVLYYIVHTTDQKENVDSFPLGDETVVPLKPNPRSLLKNNIEIKLQNDSEVMFEEVYERERLLEKRYARSKEVVQAKLFNNFINKTTIPHAPIRQMRLPRKQEIKPVDTRLNEEIIVQEVMVSSKGFFQNAKERLQSKDKFEVTSIVELSDTDDEYNPNNSSKKKKKHKKPVQASVVTSEDSDTSVIEVLHSEEESEKRLKDKNGKKSSGRPKKIVNDVLKRPRGRPPKHDGSSPQKKSKTESSEVESESGKKNFKCPHCLKTFPSQNSLSTHIQHHNLENSLRQNRFSKMEYKHKCDQCEEKFKNSILLKKHVCKTNLKLKCNICSKEFKDLSLLNIHKKTHIKQNLFNTTSTVTISPKKFLPRPSTSKFKSPKKEVTTYKCQRCSRVCPTQGSLAVHEKSHKSFPCTNCKATFASKILLDNHVRLTCVKQPSPQNRRLSFKIKKSFVQSPRRSCFKRKSVNPGVNSESMSRHLDIEVTCDSCPSQFNTLTALFKHKVKVHGLQTPDKKVLTAEKKTLHKPYKTHGGIPASDRLNKAFQGIRKQLATLKANNTLLETPEDK
nr:uncharacterized protein LOC111502827 [Leptinotarsa decemlineata]